MRRDPFYDVLKAWAIILVVVGHVIQYTMAGAFHNKVFLGIYLFHMPLFAAVSGFFFARSSARKSSMALIRSRFIHLMVPSLTFGTLGAVSALSFALLYHRPLSLSHYANPLHWLGLLWFLPIIFCLSLIGALLDRFLKSGALLVGWIMVCFLFFVAPTRWGLHQLAFLAPFFALGIGGSRFDWRKIDTRIMVGALAIFAVTLNVFKWDMSMYRMQFVAGGGGVMFKYDVIRLAGGISGILLSLFVVRLLLKCKSIVPWLSLLGTMTLPIYALHIQFVSFLPIVGFRCGAWGVLLLSAILLAVCVLCYEALRRNHYLAFFLFGEVTGKPSGWARSFSAENGEEKERDAERSLGGVFGQ